MKTPIIITCIVPRLFPAFDGVGDYALYLARQLHKDLQIKNHFIVGNDTWNGSAYLEEFSISKVKNSSADNLLETLAKSYTNSTTILLHYVGYGYEKRGCPVWLVEGLERWKASHPNCRLVTMFHEICATGKPWTSAFWLSGLQKKLATRLALLSDCCLTSKQLYAHILQNLSGGKHRKITSLPVFSTIGEPEAVPSLAKRNRRLVIFGSASNRHRVYQQSLAQLRLTCQQLGIEEICDIGTPIHLNLSAINGVPIVAMGKLPPAEISEILLNSQAGFFNYPTDFLAKSTIFSAYCSHGVLPVSGRLGKVPVDGIEAGKQYWCPDELATSWKNKTHQQMIADNAHAWYKTHTLSVQAKTFAAHFLCP